MKLGGRAKVPEFALLSHQQDPRPFGASIVFQIALLLFIAVLPRAYEVQTYTPHKQYVFTPLTAYKTVPVHMQQVVHAPKIAQPKVEVVATLAAPPEFRRPIEKIEEVKPVEVKSAKFDLAPVKIMI